MKRKQLFLILWIFWPVIGFYIVLHLYNKWFDTLDFIKYDPHYSPEAVADQTIVNLIYWSAIVLTIVVEVLLISMYKKSRRLKVKINSN